MADIESDQFSLRGWEKLAHQLGTAANHSPWGQRAQFLLLRTLTYRLAYRILGPRILTVGLDELTSFRPTSGAILVSNHRTFFDQFAILLAMVHRDLAWTETFSFPVRAKFFYDSPIGTLVNLGLGGGAMYPPIFRDTGRAALNDAAVSYLAASLTRTGHLVGIHPEGTRNRGANPYQLLPAQPGVGKIALQSGAAVLPVFSGGLTNDLWGEMRATASALGRRQHPIILVFGTPVDYADLRAKPSRLTLQKKAADRFMEHVAALMPQEQAIRAACAAGEISDADPRWLSNHPSSVRAHAVWQRSRAIMR